VEEKWIHPLVMLFVLLISFDGVAVEGLNFLSSAIVDDYIS
jgi:hypothetical protein